MITRFNNTFSYKLIYIFRINDTTHEDMVKIGEATVDGILDKSLLTDNSDALCKAARKRIDEYTKTAGIRYELLFTTLAVTDAGKGFRDYDVHSVLKRSGKKNHCFDKASGANEWFKVDLETAKNAIKAVKTGQASLTAGEITSGINPIVFRPEQLAAIEQTKKQFTAKGAVKSGQARMLWNAKMRFGKTLTGLQVAKELNFKRTLIATHRPVVSDGWFDDFTKIFYDRPDFKFGSKAKGDTLANLFKFANTGGKFVYFASIQDLRGSSLVGGNFDKNNELFACDWDYLIVDEAHEGTQTKLGDDVIRNLIKENTKTLFLSGTPFNLIKDYKEGEVFTWDYVMEQRAKMEWYKKHLGDSNPYEGLPRLNIYTYDIGKDIPNFEDIEDSAFNFREFFRTWTGDIETDKKPMPSGVTVDEFVYKEDVQSFLNLMVEKGEHNYPFSNEEYRDNFRHTLWMLPGVKAARGLSALLKVHPVFGSGAFDIVNVAGEGDEEDGSEEALQKLRNAITDKPEQTRTITLSCGRLTTGVTVDAWTACLMLSGSSSTSASSYLQTIFRVQSPANIGGKMKTDCFVFDFAPDRTLKMVAEAGNLSVKTGAINDKKLMGEFLNFCPVIGVSGSTMTAYSTEQMLAQLKRAMIDRVARNGFDDIRLYSDKLLKPLTDLEIAKFQDLKKILGASKANRNTNDIVINDQGLDTEVHECEEDEVEKKPNKELTDEEKKRKKEIMEMRKQRSAAISILRGIAIRIPLLVYGAEIADEEKGIDIDNFTKLIDDASWVEFMPKGVTKALFESFKGYFDSDIFVEAGKRIRKQAKAANELPVTKRIKALSDIFATFKNPDKETVLTPWRVVNMHLGDCIGGYNFFDKAYEKHIDIEGGHKPRNIVYAGVSDKIFSADAKVLDINSKTGLYPLYIAYSIYELLKTKHGKTKKSDDLWVEVLKNNIFAVCKTKMAAAITRRTLRGFNNYATNILVYEDIVSDMKDDAVERGKKTEAANKTVSKISNPRKWRLSGGQEMKFNAIVGNPPYQDIGGSGGSNDAPIYQNFVTTAKKLDPSIVSLIIPSRWYSGGRENLLGDFREAMLNDKGLYTIIDYPTASEVFSNVEIKGGICFFGIDSSKTDGKCRFRIIQNGIIADESIRDFSGQEYLIRYQMHQDIVGLVKLGGSKTTKYLNTIVSSDTPFGISSNPRTSKKNPMTVHEQRQKPSDLILYHIEKQKRKVEFIDRALIIKNIPDIEKFKVFIVQSAEDGDIKGKILGEIEIAPQNSVCSQSYLYVPFNSKLERDNFVKYYKTKFLRFLVSALKTTQSATNKFYAYVPIQDFTAQSDIDWTKTVSEIDKQLYDKYKLTSEQIAYIEKMITEMK